MLAISVRAWAIIRADATVLASGSKPIVFPRAVPGLYVIQWSVRLPRTCATVANIDDRTRSIEITKFAGTQFDPKVVDIFDAMPDSLWADLRREISSQIFRFAYPQKTANASV